MAGVNSTTICFDDASLQQCSSNIRCSHESVEAFHTTMGATLWQVNMLVLTDAVLAVVLVAIGAFAQRYRHHPFTRFIFLGATTMLLPITSYVVSTITQSAPIPMITSTTKTMQLRQHHVVEVFIILQLYHGRSSFRSP